MKNLIITAFLVLLAGCATSYVPTYQARVLKELPNPHGVSFSDDRTFQGQILCGRYTMLSNDGFSQVTREYVAGADFVLIYPSEMDRFIYCSDDPANMLYQQLGIGGPEVDSEMLREVQVDMRAIDTAIHSYYRANNLMPSDLEKLLSSAYGLEAANLRDPWGRPYLYQQGLAGRSTPRFDLQTLGADGVAGGRGPDADISNEHLLLLEHVMGSRGDR